MKKINIISAVLLAVGFIVIANAPGVAAQLNPCDVNPSSSLCADQNTKGDPGAVVKNIVNIILYIVGAAAVIVIIISGLRYTMSAGNPQTVAAAKSTLIYAVIGLLVAIFAYAIVAWVFDQVIGPATPPPTTPPSGP